MCARFRTAKDLERIRARFAYAPLFNFQFNPNLAPTEECPILRTGSEGKTWGIARFGLHPAWKKTNQSWHNVRSETIREKPAFRQSYERRRCIIPAEGFYEWRDAGGKKKPYYISRKDGKLITFAGIYESADIGGERVLSFAMLTGETTPLIAPYHDRMPLITDEVEEWLDLTQDSLRSFKPVPEDFYTIRPMNPSMNKASVKDLGLIEDFAENMGLR